MGVDPVAWFLGSGTQHQAVHARRLVQGVMGSPAAAWTAVESPVEHGGGHGVVGVDDLLVSAGTGMETVVAAGQAFVLGSTDVLQGSYHVTVDDSVSLTHPVADATNPRLDLVVLRIRDNDVDDGGISRAELVVLVGTPAGVPAPPAVPANSLVLARVAVDAAASAVGAITDRRVWAAALGGLQPVRTLPAAGDTQRLVWQGGRLWAWSTIHNAWQIVGGDLPRVSMLRTATQSFDGSDWTTMTFAASTTEVFDPDNTHLTGLSPGITIPEGLGGEWLVSAGIAGLGTARVRITTLNNEAITAEWSAVETNATTMSRLFRLASGSGLRLQVYASAGATFVGWITAHMVRHDPTI